jgi:hypothetical protein
MSIQAMFTRLLLPWIGRVPPLLWSSLEVPIPSFSSIYGAGITNNVLKFLGILITIWLMILECREEDSHQDCDDWMYAQIGQALVQMIAQEL